MRLNPPSAFRNWRRYCSGGSHGLHSRSSCYACVRPHRHAWRLCTGTRRSTGSPPRVYFLPTRTTTSRPLRAYRRDSHHHMCSIPERGLYICPLSFKYTPCRLWVPSRWVNWGSMACPEVSEFLTLLNAVFALLDSLLGMQAIQWTGGVPDVGAEAVPWTVVPYERNSGRSYDTRFTHR